MIRWLDELDRRHVGESRLRLIYRRVIPLFLLIMMIVKVVVDHAQSRWVSADPFLVALFACLTVVGLRPPSSPPSSRDQRSEQQEAEEEYQEWLRRSDP